MSRARCSVKQCIAVLGPRLIGISKKPGHVSLAPWFAPLLAAHDGDAPFRLAVGGPRESEAKGIYGRARVVMEWQFIGK